jgi:hypothetical protein
MLKQQKPRKPSLFAAASALLLVSACTTGTQKAASGAQDRIFETNLTNDLNLSSGEPEIAVDPTDPRNIAVIEFATGSASMPANSFNFNDYTQWARNMPGALGNSGRVVVSHDGGNTWKVRPPPVYFERADIGRYGGGDPIIAYGSRGQLYAGSEVGQPPSPGTTNAQDAMSTSNVSMALSTDHGETFNPQHAWGTPIDRPWLTVDLSNGTLYSVSSGPMNPRTGQHNVPGPEAPNDRWLIAWQADLSSKSEPRRIGGPDFSAAAGSTFAAAHGVVAAIFTLGGPAPGAGVAGASPPARPVPASLQSIMQNGVTTCSMQDPCLFFETSRDQGQTWTRHHLVVPGGMASAGRPNVAADPGHAGRFAVAMQNRDRTHFLILVTNDYGQTWPAPVTVPEAAPGPDFKPWLAYGPTGVLGLIWKDERPDIAGGPTAPVNPNVTQDAVEVGFDVYATVSCDGGTTWQTPVRVNAESSPRGVTG